MNLFSLGEYKMYCTVADLKLFLPDNITIGDTNLGTPQPGRINVNKDKLTPAEAIQYIRFAQQEIDSRLRNFYACPLRRIKHFETEIMNTTIVGAGTTITINDSGNFATGDLLRLQTKVLMETATITAISNMTTLVLDTTTNIYEAGDLISILKFPDPIPLIAARLADSYIYDELFSADQAPDMSSYGKEQRLLAMNSLDSILSGTVLLFGQEHTGKRFIRGSLFDGYSTPTKEFQFGREKS